MGLFDIFSKKTSPNTIIARAPLVQKALINQYTLNKNQDVNLKNAELLSCIYLCIKILCENVSRLPIGIYSEDASGKKTLNKKHEFYQTLRFNPKPYLSYQQWISTLITHLYLRGNAYAFIRPDSTLEIIHPDYVTDASIVGDTLWYLVSTPDPKNPNNTIDQVIKYSDLLHFKLISKDGLFGLNPIDSLRTEINTDYKSQKTVDNFFSNNAQTTKYLTQQGEFGKSTNVKIAELVEKFQDEVAGYQNAGELWVVPMGFDLKELSLYPETVKFLDAAKFSKAVIASIFGLPNYMLNENGNYSGKFEEQYLSFIQSLGGLINILKSELENKLLTPSEKLGGVTIEFDIKKLNETNLVDKANAYKVLYQMGSISPNGIAKEFNLEQSDNPMMDLHFIQSQNVPIEYMTPESFKNQKPAPVNSDDTTIDNGNNS